MELQIIENVCQHPCLYNATVSTYRDMHVKSEAWEEIAREMNLPVDVAKETWNKLRNRYIHAIKRRRSRKAGLEGKKYPPWRFQEQMSFLIPFIDSRTNSSPKSPSITDVDGESAVGTLFVQVDSDGSFTDEAEVKHQRRSSYSNTNNRSSKITDDFLKHKDDTDDFPEEIFEKKDHSVNPTYDEVDLFYLSMAKTVKRLPLLEQAKLRLAFCRMVTEAEINHLNSTHCE